MTLLRKYSFTWVTLAFFFFSLVGHWALAWSSYVSEQKEHGQPVEFSEYVIEAGRDTLENWQSEFLQLVWQSVGLALLLCWGSSQSRESDQRIEAKLDLLLADQGHDPAEVSAKVNSSVH